MPIPSPSTFSTPPSSRDGRNPYATDAWSRNDYDGAAVAAFRQASTDWAACRTRFVDDFLPAGEERQVVFLAAGLDARAWRMHWPDGATVYELDQPGVLQFKAETMRCHGVDPLTTRRAVLIDLRHDWPRALIDAGFDGGGRPRGWRRDSCLTCRRTD